MIEDAPAALRCPACGADALDRDEPPARCDFCGASLRPADSADAQVPRVAMILSGMVIGGLCGAGLGLFLGMNAWISGIVGVVVGAAVGAFTNSAPS